MTRGSGLDHGGRDRVHLEGVCLEASEFVACSGVPLGSIASHEGVCVACLECNARGMVAELSTAEVSNVSH